MLKSAVKIGSSLADLSAAPTWASNFIKKHELKIIYSLKITKRKVGFPKLLKALGKEDILKELEFNSKGYAVFKWSTAPEKTMFVLKWS